jgi:hypothetical protein
LNPSEIFTPKEISRRCNIVSNTARREISLLKKIEFIKQKSATIDELIKLKNGRIKNKKKKIQGLVLNELFPFLHPLKSLVVDSAPIDKEKVARSLKGTGRIKLIILSGVFTQSENSKVDLLLVGDAVRRSALERALKRIESELGREIVYGLFSTKEFMYRMGMYDKFVRDILDYPHEKIWNKLDI